MRLERLDLAADRALGQAQRLGRAREVQVARDRDEDLQGIERRKTMHGWRERKTGAPADAARKAPR